MTEEVRIPTEIWLMGQLRQISARGDFYTILHRGEGQTGTVIARHLVGRDIYLYQQNRNINGVLGWLRLAPKGQTHWVVEQSWADGYITRAIQRDPDLWVVDIETRDPVLPLEGLLYDTLAG